jgi:Ni,Fe-hydrogenase III small subunit
MTEWRVKPGMTVRRVKPGMTGAGLRVAACLLVLVVIPVNTGIHGCPVKPSMTMRLEGGA